MIPAIERKLELQQSPETVWNALTEPTQVAAWFGESARFEAKPGGEGYFGWQSHGRFAMRIEAFEPPRRLVWRWGRDADKSLEETHSTVVEWTLLPRDDGGTTLLLKESGFATEQSRQENTEGWNHELAELEEYLASG